MAKIIDGTKRELLASLDLASELIENGDIPKALDELTLANSEHPNNPECMAELALLLADVGLYDESISIYGELIREGTLPDEQSALEAFGIVMPEKEEQKAFYNLIARIFPDIDPDYFTSSDNAENSSEDEFVGEGLIDEMQRSLSKGDYAAVKRYFRSMRKDNRFATEAMGIAMKAAYLDGDKEEAFKMANSLFAEYSYTDAADIILRILFDSGNSSMFRLYLMMFKEKIVTEIGENNYSERLAATLMKSLYALKQYGTAVELFKDLFKIGIKYDLAFLTYAYCAAFAAGNDEIVDVIASFCQRTVPHCAFLRYLKSVFSEYTERVDGSGRDKYLAVRLIADNALYRFTGFPGFIAAKPVYPLDSAGNDPETALIRRLNDPYLYEYSPRLFSAVIKTLVGHIA